MYFATLQARAPYEQRGKDRAAPKGQSLNAPPAVSQEQDTPKVEKNGLNFSPPETKQAGGAPFRFGRIFGRFVLC